MIIDQGVHILHHILPIPIVQAQLIQLFRAMRWHFKDLSSGKRMGSKGGYLLMLILCMYVWPGRLTFYLLYICIPLYIISWLNFTIEVFIIKCMS